MEKYLPNMYQKDIFHINYDKLKEKGIKYLLFDLDNTLATIKEDKPSPKVKKLITNLKKDFTVILVSNSLKKRVSAFASSLDIPYFSFAMKPCGFVYRRIKRKFEFQPWQMAMIGDQLMSDIRFGNKHHLFTILVDRLANDEFKITSINRYRENKILALYAKQNVFKKGKYYE